MDDASETFDKTTFDYVRARRAMDAWVDHLNDKHVNWAWEILMGTAEVYASFTGHPIEQGRASIWCDFFDAWQNGTANLGILGILQELACACPDAHAGDLERIMGLARDAGLTGKSVPRDLTWCMTKTQGTKGRPVATEAKRARAGLLPAAPAQRLRLVVGDATGTGPKPRRTREGLRLIPGNRPLAGTGEDTAPEGRA